MGRRESLEVHSQTLVSVPSTWLDRAASPAEAQTRPSSPCVSGPGLHWAPDSLTQSACPVATLPVSQMSQSFMRPTELWVSCHPGPPPNLPWTGPRPSPQTRELGPQPWASRRHLTCQQPGRLCLLAPSTALCSLPALPEASTAPAVDLPGRPCTM